MKIVAIADPISWKYIKKMPGYDHWPLSNDFFNAKMGRNENCKS